ncbi:MAG: pyroglutamyl-peptidase I [Acholeplasmataceae bacterium]
MKKIVLTAFEPFGSIESNVTIAILNKIKQENSKVKTYILPVVFAEVKPRMIEIIEKEEPDVLIMLGQAAGALKIRIEKTALNYVNATIVDNKNNQPLDQKINNDENTAYFTTIDDVKLYQQLDHNYVERSYSAGTYVCNYLYFETLSYINKTNKKIDAIFIHYPLSTEQAEAQFKHLPLSILVEQTKKIINYLMM